MQGHLDKVMELRSAGVPFVTVTLVDAVGSVPADQGSRMIIIATGLHHGTIGGGRLEARAITQSQAMLQDANAPANLFVDWNLQRDIGMTCGGTVKLYFERHTFPIWNIFIFGAGHVAQAVVRTLLNLDCKLTCIDARQEWLARLPESIKLTVVNSAVPASLVKDIPAGAFVLLMTMGHSTDSPILAEVLKRDDFAYVGVIGSAAKRLKLRNNMVQAGISPEKFERVHCPIGLPLGTNHAYEIAISITAQLLMVRDKLIPGVSNS